MTSILIRESRPVARKEHRCMLCTGPIKPGERYTRDVMKHDDLYEWIECAACVADRVGVEVYGWVWCADEGYTADDAYEWAVAHALDPKVGDIAQRYLERRNYCFSCGYCQPCDCPEEIRQSKGDA